MVRPIAVAIFILYCTASNCDARNISASELYSHCTHPVVGSADNVSCDAYILGLAQGIGIAVLGSLDGVKWCIPDSAEGYQFRQIFEKSMREHPERVNMPASAAVGLSLLQAYRCQ